MAGYKLIAKRGDVDDFGEDTYFYKIFRRMLFQGMFSSEDVSRMKEITYPKRGESYFITDMIAFALGATHKKYVGGVGLSFQIYYYEKVFDDVDLPKIDCSEVDYSNI